MALNRTYEKWALQTAEPGIIAVQANIRRFLQQSRDGRHIAVAAGLGGRRTSYHLEKLLVCTQRVLR